MSVLGNLQEAVLLAAVQSGDGAPAGDIYNRIVAAHAGSGTPAFGAVYTTIKRMVAADVAMMRAEIGTARDDRARHLYTVTAAGHLALVRAQQVRERLGASAFRDNGETTP